MTNDDHGNGDGDGGGGPRQERQRGPERIKCAGCDRLILPGRGRRRAYCTEACKQRAYRERKAERAAAGDGNG